MANVNVGKLSTIMTFGFAKVGVANVGNANVGQLWQMAIVANGHTMAFAILGFAMLVLSTLAMPTATSKEQL